MDALSPLLERYALSARVFFAGALCDASAFSRQPGLGTLHVLRRGTLHVDQESGPRLTLAQPSVLFFPEPYAHGFHVDPAAGADLVCAWIDFGAGVGNPLLRGLPHLILAPLAHISGIEWAFDTLFGEAFATRLGRQAALNRLTEYILVLLLRHAMEAKLVQGSALAGLADARLCKAILAMHAQPEFPWSLESLAKRAGMSRARFAAHFRTVTGATPLDYLTDWRIGIAQTLLKQGTPLKLVAPRVGYASSVALTRAFARCVGITPTQWHAQS
jgi:AraC-like DNA-binding protein